MASVDQSVKVYQSLAEAYDRSGENQLRDRFLVLAADAAMNSGQGELAEQFHTQLLRRNPHHLLKPFATFAEAMKSRDVLQYVNALRRSNPITKAEQMLGSLVLQAPMPEPPPFGPTTAALTTPTTPATIPMSPPAPSSAPASKAEVPRELRLFQPAPAERPRASEPSAPTRPAPAASAPPTTAFQTPAPAPPPAPPAPSRAAPLPPPPALPEPPASVPMLPLSFPDLPAPRQPMVPLAMEPLPMPPPRSAPLAIRSEADVFHPPRQEYDRGRPSWLRSRPSLPWEQPVPTSGGWFCTVLFILVVAAGLSLAAYTLGKPFVPPGWTPW